MFSLLRAGAVERKLLFKQLDMKNPYDDVFGLLCEL